MTTKTDIISISKTILDYFKKNKTYPKSIKIKGTDYTIQEATYLMSSFITKPREEIPKIKVGGATSPTGDRVNRRVIKQVYTDMSKRCTEYIEKNKKLPNYVTIDGKQKCSIILFMLQLSKIISSYDGAFPSAILINSQDLIKKTYKKYGHATKQGCDNIGQNNGYYCAPHMVQEIIRNLTGKIIPQSTLASVMGTTTSGTDHDGINTAFQWFNRNYDFNLTTEWKNFSDLGWTGINKILNSTNQDVGIHELYRDTWGHYTIYNKITDSYVLVQNSLGDYCSNGCYCGYVETRDLSTARRYISGISQKSVLVVTNK